MSAGYPVVSVEQMRALEARAFAAGISEDDLQARAAAEVARVAGGLAPAGGRVVVLVGPGNNGRDAFLAGRLLAQRGRLVHYHLTPRHAIRDAEQAALVAGQESLRVHAGTDDEGLLGRELARSCLAIDGLLGIGVRGPLRRPLDALARQLNLAAERGLGVLAVDVPSGIDADSGAAPADAVRASTTVALGAVKAGTLRFPARALAGEIVPRPIGLPPEADQHLAFRLLDWDQVRSLVPARPLDAHKGSLGWVVVVGGSRDYVGAPILSAAAAARSGCGLVALSVTPNTQAAAGAALPEATYLLREETEPAAIQAERIVARLADYEALVVGPGLGRSNASQGLTRSLLVQLAHQQRRPTVVLDADALFALAAWPDWSRAVPPGCVLTPHHGEMARLTGLESSTLAAAAWETALEWATHWGQIVVLKSALTVVASPAGRAWVYPRPNPALATAGTGDVLAGLIAGLAAQGLGSLDAARLAVATHAGAAERVVRRNGWRSLLASDLPREVPAVLVEQGADS